MEEVCGESFPRLMKENLFDPLGIKNSTFSHNLSKNEKASIAKGYKYDGSMVKEVIVSILKKRPQVFGARLQTMQQW